MPALRSPRIVSLLPSATEIACALGFEEAIVGRSHECDWPAAIAALPPVTMTKLAKGLGSVEIERRVRQIVAAGLSVYEVDAPLLKALKPDVVLTQTHCAACAVTPADLAQALADWIGVAPDLVTLAPGNMGGVWGDFARVGAALGVVERADRVVADLKARISTVSARVADRPRPRVAAIEWLDPLMAAGNWIPELIEAAGGENLLSVPGQHCGWLAWTRLAAADPDLIVIMSCGFSIAQTLAELPELAADPRWRALRAVRKGRVYVTDGQYFFNRPGPRLVESAEILAEIFHPGVDFGHEGAGWTRIPQEIMA